MGERLPTLETCDQDDPRQCFQWALVALPFGGAGQGFTMHPDTRELWSQRLVDLAFVHAPTIAQLADENGMIHVSQLPEPKLKFRAPYRGQQHTLNGSAAWVPVDDDDPSPVSIPNMDDYTPHEQEVVAEQLRYTGVVKDKPPVADVAAVAGARELFQPGDHSPSTVNGYLMAAGEQERRRVLAVEMTGKHRDQILRRWPAE
ncbi:DUF2744 domain-containing protein [Rhodococcus sp. D2-41]|uniref:phage gene 29 protein family protein n=1 Tax=Speluncibacter jeojiensis TaxID=2710754 RepID=UPI00240F5D82|nr:DUF2744 domain-containing protein [Rhodococcus sp. D2-41]MDG3012139.1 DUF2744 domain-containing protein [Rhodococcus sp. D2-41]